MPAIETLRQTPTELRPACSGGGSEEFCICEERLRKASIDHHLEELRSSQSGMNHEYAEDTAEVRLCWRLKVS